MREDVDAPSAFGALAFGKTTREAAAAIIQRFADNSLFRDASAAEVYIVGNPYRRPTRLSDNTFIDYASPLNKNTIASNDGLATHRLLLNAYEIDCLFLPSIFTRPVHRDMNDFYGCENQINSELARPILEKKAFSFLEDEIEITGNWTPASVIAYLQDFKEREDARLQAQENDSAILRRLLSCSDQKPCAKHYLVQLASDFLSEASAMARFSLGNYGLEQSELFNILIDEYGRAVYKYKHSRLFENLLHSIGLSSEIHRYWQFYHASSLMLTNYFHYLGKNKANYFRYLGALFFTEASLSNVSRQQALAMRQIFGDSMDVTYFTEHVHIDRHHGSMTLERIVRPTLEKYGTYAAADIVRGFDEFKLLQDLADRDLLAQICWIDERQKYSRAAQLIWGRIASGELQVPKETFLECFEERSTTHVHGDHRLVVIESGEMDFWAGVGEPVHLKAGDAHLVPRHRLHGSVITSQECLYHQPVVSDGLLQGVLAEVGI